MTTQQRQSDNACTTCIRSYFEAFNKNDFATAATLFTADGELYPPFEKAIVGRVAITNYLEQNASQMMAYPQESFGDCTEDGQLQVVGRVDTIAFRVGVEWTFSFTEAFKIQSLSIRLKASMKELLSMRSA